MGEDGGVIHLKYRPLPVEARKVTRDNLTDVALWCEGVILPGRGVGMYSPAGDFVHAMLGDWVIRGSHGHYFPLPDRMIFGAFESPLPSVQAE